MKTDEVEWEWDDGERRINKFLHRLDPEDWEWDRPDDGDGDGACAWHDYACRDMLTIVRGVFSGQNVDVLHLHMHRYDAICPRRGRIVVRLVTGAPFGGPEAPIRGVEISRGDYEPINTWDIDDEGWLDCLTAMAKDPFWAIHF